MADIVLFFFSFYIRYGKTDNLPEELKSKLKVLPSVIEHLAKT